METAIFYPGTKNDTVQRVMYIERPCVAGKWVYLTVKRTLDTCFALIGLIVFTLPMSVIALIIALDSPGDPIFKQERLGKDGKPFIMYKFAPCAKMPSGTDRDGRMRMMHAARTLARSCAGRGSMSFRRSGTFSRAT